ncbi:extracellular solute-binding protein [Crossiella sp. NPDC003009]
MLSPLLACGDEQPTPSSPPAAAGQPPTLVVYSGRTEKQIGQILGRMEQAIGVKLDVRYGDSAKLADQLATERQDSPADLFISQDAGALGLLENKDLLAELPDEIRQAVPGAYRSVGGRWVALSARARVIAYDSKQVSPAQLPTSADDLLLPRWRGKIGYAPGNGSWHSFVTALRVLRGEEGARTWLTRFKGNNPRRFESNWPILDAVDRGEVALGLINHYYWYEKAAQVGADKLRARLHHVSGNDPAALVNIAGACVLRGGDAPLAHKAVEFLLSEPAQQFFADHIAEYPVRAGIRSTKHRLPPLAEISGPDLNLNRLASLQESLKLLAETGLR